MGLCPVNTIGSIVDLTPGSISIAVDRLVSKGLVSRVESAEDRRVRIVALTPRGRGLIVSAFRKHSGQMKRVFSELSLEELRGLEVKLKKVGKARCRADGGELSGCVAADVSAPDRRLNPTAFRNSHAWNSTLLTQLLVRRPGLPRCA